VETWKRDYLAAKTWIKHGESCGFGDISQVISVGRRIFPFHRLPLNGTDQMTVLLVGLGENKELECSCPTLREDAKDGAPGVSKNYGSSAYSSSDMSEAAVGVE
jgi:hypothetical protein